jgi:ribonuclease BN (tRNA processing enzyme)
MLLEISLLIKIRRMKNLLPVAVIALLSMLSLFAAACTQAESRSGPGPAAATGEPEISDLQPTLPYVIVDTGQTGCYDNSKEMPPPVQGAAFYGQDAQYTANQPAYRDNGDGTISDLNTGLMWQKTIGAKVTYAEASTGAESSNLAGYIDWRLPTIKELFSLILFSGMDVSPLMNSPGTSDNLVPFLDTGYFDFKYGNTGAGERIIDGQYWSSTEYVSTTMNGMATVFGVNFADGRIKGYPKTTPRGENLLYVRYVRGNRDYGINDFRHNGDGTITDRATGLMWAKEDSGEGLNWQEALAWVQQKNDENFLGYSDWRLPNAKELQSIVDYSRSLSTTGSAAINPLFNVSRIMDEGGKTNYPFYWTGTTHADSNNRGTFAVYVCFGEALGYMQSPNSGRQVSQAGQRPGVQPSSGDYELMDVHGAGAQRSDPKAGSVNGYPYGRGPQGDVVRIYNHVRCVRDAGATTVTSVSTDDFSVVTLGTGGPIYNPERAGPSALVRYKDSFFLVDMGNGTQAGLNYYGVLPRDIGALMLTHHHIDHNEEFTPILLRVLLARTGDINIFGPPGTHELYYFTRDYYWEDLTYRAARTGTDPNRAASINIKQLTGGDNLEINSVNIRTAEVVHTIFTIAYRFDTDGKSIVISGDTAYSENLVELAKGADIMVMDSGGVIMKGESRRNWTGTPSGRPGQAANQNSIGPHASLEEVADMANKAGVKRLVLTHFRPGELDEEATVSVIKSIYTGEVIFGSDLMKVTCE